MRLLFIFNDAARCMLQAEYESVMPAVSRRVVNIELTPEQDEKIRRIQQGSDCGRPVYEVLESITLKEDVGPAEGEK